MPGKQLFDGDCGDWFKISGFHNRLSKYDAALILTGWPAACKVPPPIVRRKSTVEMPAHRGADRAFACTGFSQARWR